MIFSPTGLKCDFSHQLIIQNSEYNEVRFDQAKDGKKAIQVMHINASDGSNVEKVNIRSVVWQILTKIDDIKERCMNKYKEKSEEYITK